MNTLLLAPELFSSDGGIPRILRLYLKALCELSDPHGSVKVIALNDIVFDSRDLRRYSNPRLTDWAACSRNKLRFVRLAHQMSASTDIVVCGHVAQLPVAWALKKIFRRKMRYALVAHGIEVWRPFSFWERLALKGADRIWCVSEFTRRELLRFYKRPLPNVVVLPNALDPHLAADALPGQPADLDILTVSRLNQSDNYKGIDHLIEAMPIVRRAIPAARLRIVGQGDDLPRLHARAKKLNLGEAVIFTGHVNDLGLRRELASCRVFALPSQKEGFGLVYLEAMTHGKPCIGARDGGTPEVIAPESGLLVNYGDVPGLAGACIEALRRTWDPHAIRARAEHFSYSHFRDRLAALLPLSA